MFCLFSEQKHVVVDFLSLTLCWFLSRTLGIFYVRADFCFVFRTSYHVLYIRSNQYIDDIGFWLAVVLLAYIYVTAYTEQRESVMELQYDSTWGLFKEKSERT